MLITLSLAIIIVIVMFSLILGKDIISTITEIGVDNESLVDGVPITYVVENVDVIFTIDISNLVVAGIVLLSAIILIATITGIQVLGSGLSPASVRIYILLTGFVGIWGTLSILALDLIISIQIFGSVIYITLTLMYTIGVIQKITGSE